MMGNQSVIAREEDPESQEMGIESLHRGDTSPPEIRDDGGKVYGIDSSTWWYILGLCFLVALIIISSGTNSALPV